MRSGQHCQRTGITFSGYSREYKREYMRKLRTTEWRNVERVRERDRRKGACPTRRRLDPNIRRCGMCYKALQPGEGRMVPRKSEWTGKDILVLYCGVC